jgi:hypothetical protein
MIRLPNDPYNRRNNATDARPLLRSSMTLYSNGVIRRQSYASISPPGVATVTTYGRTNSPTAGSPGLTYDDQRVDFATSRASEPPPSNTAD